MVSRQARRMPGRRTQPAPEADLTILCTTDLHMQILSYDYLADRAADVPSLARLVPVIRRLQAGASKSLLLDCGDFLQGGPMGDLYGDGDGRGPPCTDRPHPMLAAMTALGYDAVALGNHEFNFGLPVLERVLRDATFPVLSCNLISRRGSDPTRDRTLVPPFALLERTVTARDGSQHQLRIGILGLAPPETVQWERARLEGLVEARPMREAARAWVPALRARGAEVVIVLAHVGPRTQADRDTVLALAAMDGIDALCLGHVHGVFPAPQFAGMRGADIERGTLAGKPAVMAGHGGSHIGRITLRLRRGASGWTVAGGSGGLVPARGAIDGARMTEGIAGRVVQRAAAQAHARTLDHIRTPVGATRTPLDSYFAALGDSPAQRLVGAAMRHWMTRTAADPLPASVPVLAAVPAFRAGGTAGPDHFTDIPAGVLHMRHLHDLYPFPNLLVALRLTGAEVLDWLERVAAQYPQARIGSEQPLVTEAVPAWSLDAMIGLDYAFDLSKPPRYRLDGTPTGVGPSRLIRAGINGRPLDPEIDVVVVTSTHRAAGGGVFRAWPAARQVSRAAMPGRTALAEYLRGMGAVAIPPHHARRLNGPPGTTLLLDTAPAAGARRERIAAYRPEIVTVTPDGFLRLRLHL